MLKELYTQIDFLNLTADDIKRIKRILGGSNSKRKRSIRIFV